MKNIKALLVLAFVGLVPISNVNADTIVFEDFEDATVTYTSSVPDDLSDIGALDYYGRLASDTTFPGGAVSYSNLQGTGYYGVQDSDSSNTPASSVALLWNAVDTSNFTGLSLSWFVGEDDDGTSQDWDSDTSFLIEVDLDGAGFNPIFQVESENVAGDETNERPLVDTDFNGEGDGTEITDSMAQFSTLLADAGTVSIRVTFTELNAGDEDIAFDSLHLEGTFAVPEPGTTGLLGFAFIGIGCFRRRKA